MRVRGRIETIHEALYGVRSEYVKGSNAVTVQGLANVWLEFAGQPLRDWHEKSFLFSFHHFPRKIAKRGLLKQIFGYSVTDFPISGKGGDEFNHRRIEVRTAHL